MQPSGPTNLANQHGGRNGIAQQQEHKRRLESDQLEHPTANFLQREHLVGAQVFDPVVDDAGLEQRGEHRVHRVGQVRTAAEHELSGVRAQQAPGQETYGYLDLDAFRLRLGEMVHEPLHLEQGDVPFDHQPVDDPLEVRSRQQLQLLHERPRQPARGRRRVDDVQRPRAGHRDQVRLEYLVRPGELDPVKRHRHEAAQRGLVRHVYHHAVPQPVDHEHPEAAPHGLHVHRLIDGRLEHEERHGRHPIQLVQFPETVEYAWKTNAITNAHITKPSRAGGRGVSREGG